MNNRWYVLFSKSCFICSVFFFVFVTGNLLNIPISTHFTYIAGFIITVAYLSFFLNFTAGFLLIVLLLKGLRNVAPAWIISFNIFTLFFQIFYFLLI